MQFTGIVVSGLGRGAQFLALEWVAVQLRQHLDLTPYPGTLNLRVLPEVRHALFDRRQEYLRITDPASPECPGYVQGITLRANARIIESAFLMLPEKSVHHDVLEIIAAVCLRDALALTDGDPVQVEPLLGE
jgi:riboflavin kinase